MLNISIPPLFKIFLPILPPGINQTYKRSKKNSFYKSEEAKVWEQEIRQIFELVIDQQNWKDKPGRKYSIRIWWSGSRHDADAFLKIVVDAIAFELGINDNRILDKRITKLNSPIKKGLLIELRSYEQSDIPPEFQITPANFPK